MGVKSGTIQPPPSIVPVVRIGRRSRQSSNAGGEGTPAVMTDEMSYDRRALLRSGRNVATPIMLKDTAKLISGLAETILEQRMKKLRDRHRKRKRRHPDDEADEDQNDAQDS